MLGAHGRGVKRWQSAKPRRLAFRKRYRCDHLLLVVSRVAAVVIGADEGGVVGRAGKLVAEVVADERVRRIARTAAIGTVELGIPVVLRQSNVVPDWLGPAYRTGKARRRT